jgi:two-component system response regulator PilR (NtrC family)
MNEPIALIVDDEPDILELLEITLGRMQIQCVRAGDLKSARQALGAQRFDLCLSDMRLPDGDGIDLVRHIAANHPHLPVAMITAHGNMETAIQAMKAGAFDFVSKPVDLAVLRRLVDAALKLRAPSCPPSGALQLLGDSEPMARIRQLVAKLARSQAPVYISGESGTGKELVARLIHAQGPRCEEPFIAVNCGAIPKDLVESEFFGYRKGSFTGAASDRDGLFQAADGGTLFLDEVADLPLDMQVKLLRAIQEKAVRPIGAATETAVDVRIVSATHQNLTALVEQGDFRQDLFYRINVIGLPIPPLRQRPEDIPALVKHLLQRIAAQSGMPVPDLDRDALQALRGYRFPGNVRELENILERAVALCEDGLILTEDLQLPVTAAPARPTEADQELPLEDMLGDLEKQTILKALEETRWNRTAAARKLGMSLRSLRYRLAKLGLN